MAQLWNTDSQGAYTSLDPITGTVLTTLKCKDPTKCAEQQQREGVVMADVYYTIRYHHAPTLHGFDLTTGNVSCLIKLPFQQFGFSAFGMGVYGLAADEKRGRLLAIGPMAPFGAASYAHALFSIDPINGTYTQVGQANLAPLPASSSTFDPEARVFYTLYAVGISTSVLGIAVDDGSVVLDQPLSTRNPLYTIDYYQGDLIGLGLDFLPDTQFRNLQRFDLATKQATTLLNLTSYAMNMPATALNADAATLTAFLLPTNSIAANLVTISLTNLTVVAEPQLCTQYDMCGLTLAWEK